MWITFQQAEELYLLNTTTEHDVKVNLTNLKDFWMQSLSKDNILKRLTELNPLIDIKLQDATSAVLDLIQNDSNKSIEYKEHAAILTITSSLNGEYRLRFDIELTRAPDKLSENITIPLIQTVKYLEDKHKMLTTLIQKKDRELEEYKLEKGDISRTDLVTEKFEDTEIKPGDGNLVLNVFGKNESFWNVFAAKYGNSQPAIEDIKNDPWNHVQRKRKVYSSKTATKRCKGIDYSKAKD